MYRQIWQYQAFVKPLDTPSGTPPTASEPFMPQRPPEVLGVFVCPLSDGLGYTSWLGCAVLLPVIVAEPITAFAFVAASLVSDSGAIMRRRRG